MMQRSRTSTRRAATALALLALTAPTRAAEAPVPGERDIPADTTRPNQREAQSPPPAAPADTPADPGAPLPERAAKPAPAYRLQRVPSSAPPAAPPSQFNPDPGAANQRAADSDDAFFKTNQVEFPRAEDAPISPELALPRTALETSKLVPLVPNPPVGNQLDPLPEDQKLPREGVRENVFIEQNWHAPASYPRSEAGIDIPAHSRPAPDRWRDTGFTPWRRYTSGNTNEIPYADTEAELWHPYRQSRLKGDLPIHGQEVFLAVTASAELIYEDRKLMVPSGASAASPGSADFFGESRSQIFVSNLALDFLLFKGETVFKPVDWAVKIRPVLNYNRVRFRETGIVSPNPGGPAAGNFGPPVDNTAVFDPDDIDALLGEVPAGVVSVNPAPVPLALSSKAVTRNRNYAALQEAFVEVHLVDLSSNYDFVALKAGNQVFNSDFRGFIFNETNLGVRLLGNADSNRYQYNLALFDLREKDTNSELNTFNARDQRVLIANLYRQDFIWKGYTAQVSYHGNFDKGGTHYDRNGGIVRPAPLGTPVAHDLKAHYYGWAGDGHIGRWNLSHAAYVAVGQDDFNGLAGRPVDIFAHMAALEVSYDRDWIRYKASAFYASGDSDPTDDKATGFDSIVDNVNFTGGPFSYYTRQGFNLAGTAVGVKQRFSLVPNLRTSKTQGQANFVNPGIFITGVGADIEITPKLRSFLSANYIRFVTTEPMKTALLTNRIDEEFGIDLGVGFQWRPLLTDNIIASLGCGVLLPGTGFDDIYRDTQPVVPGFTSGDAQPESLLYSAIAAITFTY